MCIENLTETASKPILTIDKHLPSGTTIKIGLGGENGFVVIGGFAKARKTFLQDIIVSSAYTDQYSNGLQLHLKPDDEIIYFDADQTMAESFDTRNNLYEMCGGKPINYTPYNIKKYSPAVKRQLLPKFVYSHTNPKVIIYDNVNFFLNSTNSELETIEFMDTITAISAETGCLSIPLSHMTMAADGHAHLRGVTGGYLNKVASTIFHCDHKRSEIEGYSKLSMEIRRGYFGKNLYFRQDEIDMMPVWAEYDENEF